MTIHLNFIFYLRIPFEALSCLVDPSVRVACAPQAERGSRSWILNSSLDLCFMPAFDRSANRVPSG